MSRGGAASFGDVTGEYLALHRRAGYLTGWHDLVWVRGPDAVTFLDGLVSQSVAGMEDGGVAASLLLSPQGKLRAPHWLLRGEAEVGLIADAGGGEVVAGDLRRFKIRVDVEIEAEEAPVVTVVGPDAAGAIAEVTGSPVAAGWRGSEAVVATVPFRRVDLPRFVTVGVTPEQFATAGVVRAGRAAGDAVRIEAGEPVMGIDVDDGTIPQETGLVSGAVDFAKGCYLGQELVARIDSRGHVNRHLRAVVITANVIPPAGAEIVAGERAVGRVTSLAESLELRAPVGLSLLRREVDAGDLVEVRWSGGSAPAAVESLPTAVFTDS